MNALKFVGPAMAMLLVFGSFMIAMPVASAEDIVIDPTAIAQNVINRTYYHVNNTIIIYKDPQDGRTCVEIVPPIRTAPPIIIKTINIPTINLPDWDEIVDKVQESAKEIIKRYPQIVELSRNLQELLDRIR